MPSVTLEEAQARLPELIEALIPGEELMIMKDGHMIARLTRQRPPSQEPRKPGSARGKLIILQEDDEHLEDFKEYME